MIMRFGDLILFKFAAISSFWTSRVFGSYPLRSVGLAEKSSRILAEKNKNSRMCNGECVLSHFLRLLCGLLAKLRQSIKGWAATRQAVKGLAQMMYFCLTRIQSKVPLSWKSFTKTNLLGAKPTVSCSNLRDASMPFYYLVYSMMRLLASACEDTFRVSLSLPSNLKLTMKISALLKV